MTVKTDDAIAIAITIAAVSGFETSPVFQSMRSKAHRILHARFFPRYEQVTGNW